MKVSNIAPPNRVASELASGSGPSVAHPISSKPQRTFSSIEDTGRLAGFLLMRVAADFLPASWGRAFANLCGRIASTAPASSAELRKGFERELEINAVQSARLSKNYLARPFHDYLFLRRLINGRDKIADLLCQDIEERNAEVVEDLRGSGSSYIIATGHFTREAVFWIHPKKVIPEKIVSIVDPLRPLSPDIRKLWIRFHFGQMLEVLKLIRDDMKFIFAGHSNTWSPLVRCLRKPGHVAVISVDAPWDGKKGFTRSFFGKSAYRFSTGAARLARMIQCPIVLCTPYLDEDEKPVLEWKRRIDPPDPANEEADLATTNMMLDEIEHAIRKRPDQYIMGLLDTS